MRQLSTSFIFATFICSPALAQTFQLKDQFIGKDFLSGFEWNTFDDPTHGRVNYVDQQTALQKQLTVAEDNKFTMSADSNSTVPANARGRDSVRITSHNTYTDAVIVLDLAHMPTGCATWPAFWTVTSGTWPDGGEIDIIEGVNTGTSNLASLHTNAGCTLPQSRSQTATPTSLDCNAAVNGNQGCGNSFTTPNSYGPGFNSAGGGWYVLKRTTADGAYVYFWSRNDPSVPAAVKSGDKSISPDDSWGTPAARFPTDSCNWAQHFNSHSIVFDLTFCGDWAGSAFGSAAGCSGSCTDFVDNNPQAFKEAYWEVNALRVYTP